MNEPLERMKYKRRKRKRKSVAPKESGSDTTPLIIMLIGLGAFYLAVVALTLLNG